MPADEDTRLNGNIRSESPSRYPVVPVTLSPVNLYGFTNLLVTYVEPLTSV